MLQTNPNTQSEFARLFEESLSKKSFKVGDIVTATVLDILKDFVVVDIGFKSEGRIAVSEFKTPTGEVTCKVGDKIEVLLEEIENKDGMVVLSKERSDAVRTWDKLVQAYDKSEVVEGTIVSKVKGGMSVDIGVKAFLPGSQVDIRPVRNLDKFVGKKFRFKIVKMSKRRGNVVVSRKAVLEKERESMKSISLDAVQEGQILDGVVKNVTDYGLFVDLGGFDGLVHITDMTWGRINHPSELFSVGDDIRVKVTKIDPETKRVSLGLKQLALDPWEQAEGKFPVGSRLTGKVVNITDYGAFIELEHGIEGLVHVSEMSWTKKVRQPSKLVNIGDLIEAIVLDIDIANRRISLGMKQLQPNPWDHLSDKFPVGSQVKGTVKNIADFGVFADVGGEVDGLVHVSDISWIQNFEHPSDTFQKGQQIEAVVLNIDPEQERFSLGIKQLNDDPWGEILDTYKKGDEIEGKVSKVINSGLLVELSENVVALLPTKNVQGEPKVGDEIKAAIAILNHREGKLILNMKKE